MLSMPSCRLCHADVGDLPHNDNVLLHRHAVVCQGFSSSCGHTGSSLPEGVASFGKAGLMQTHLWERTGHAKLCLMNFTWKGIQHTQCSSPADELSVLPK